MDVRASESLSSWFSWSGSGQYLLEPYHTEEFIQNQADVTQSILLTAFNWLIMTLFPDCIFMLIIIFQLQLFLEIVYRTVLGALRGVLLKSKREQQLRLSSVVVICDKPWRMYSNSYLFLQHFNRLEHKVERFR